MTFNINDFKSRRETCHVFVGLPAKHKAFIVHPMWVVKNCLSFYSGSYRAWYLITHEMVEEYHCKASVTDFYLARYLNGGDKFIIPVTQQDNAFSESLNQIVEAAKTSWVERLDAENSQHMMKPSRTKESIGCQWDRTLDEYMELYFKDHCIQTKEAVDLYAIKKSKGRVMDDIEEED